MFRAKTSNLKNVFFAASLAMGIVSCGSAGSDADSTVEAGSSTVRGSIVASDGDQGKLSNWVIVALDRELGSARVAVISGAGLFQFEKMDITRPITFALLTTDYKFTSILSLTSPAAGTIRQYFRPIENLPKLVHRGQVMTFFKEDDLEIEKDVAADGDADLIPDGMDPDALALKNKISLALASDEVGYEEDALSLVASLNDFDRDGIPDIKDPDIDGDGIPNEFDTNEDGDEYPDIFDGDANGNLVNDTSETEGDLFFNDGAHFIAVQSQKAVDSSGVEEATVTINTKLRDGVNPLAIDVRGAPSLFNGATIYNITVNAEGAEEVISSAWDKRLLDDGASNDSSEDDRIYGRKVVLGTGKVPKIDQVLFVRYAFGTTSAPWFVEFPYTFPEVKTNKIRATYDKTLKRITMVGSPFDTQKNYKWFVDVVGTIDEKEGVVYTSPEQNGADGSTFVIPDGTLESGTKYKISVRAQAMDKVPSYPSYVVKSAEIEITYE